MNELKEFYESLQANKKREFELYEKKCLSYEEYCIQYDNYESIKIEREKILKEIHRELEKNVDLFYKTPYKTGVVYTKFKEDMLKGQFLLWIDSDYSVNHKFFYMNDILKIA